MSAQQTSILDFIKIAKTSDKTLKPKFRYLAKTGKFLRGESKKHFCVYFAGVDVNKKKIFMGFHKKAQLWLCNGGHMDAVETVDQAVHREIGEEWGLAISQEDILPQHFLTITKIKNPIKQPLCSHHYDLWHFVDLDSTDFHPDEKKLAEEFTQWGWISFDAIKLKIDDDNTLRIVQWLQSNGSEF